MSCGLCVTFIYKVTELFYNILNIINVIHTTNNAYMIGVDFQIQISVYLEKRKNIDVNK